MKRQVVVGLVGLALMASAAWSQQAAPGQGEGAGQRRARPGVGQRGMRAGGMGDVEQAVTLTAEQRQEVQKLSEQLREQMREQFAGVQRDPAAFEKQRQLRQEMLEAARAGDEEKVAALRKQLDETGMMAGRRELLSKYYDDVEKILTAEQKKQFQAWRKLQESEVPAGLLANPEALRAAVNRIETLSDIQKNQIDAAFARYEKAAEAAKPDDVEARRALTQELAAAVVGALKPSQKVLLGQAAFGAMRRGEGPRGARGSAPAPGAEQPQAEPPSTP